MKAAFITDTHLGARGGSQVFREYFKWYYEEIFFPYLKKKGIKDILHLGDFFDNRNFVTLKDIEFVKNVFLPLLDKYKIRMSVIAGNHDLAFKNTNSVTSLSLLDSGRVKVYKDEVVEFELGDQRFAYVPWINNNNYQEFMEQLDEIQQPEEVRILGHFEINGMKMYKDSIRCEGGIDQKVFKKFKSVWSGHFHHPSKSGNIEYLGSLFHFTWQDYGDYRGFWVYDSETDDKEYVENEYCLFTKILYDQNDIDKLTEDDYKTLFNHQFVTIVIDDEYDKVKFMDFYSKVTAQKPIDVQIINNYAILGESTSVKGSENTSTDISDKSIDNYIVNYVNKVVEKKNQKSIVKKLSEVKKKAEDRMVAGE